MSSADIVPIALTLDERTGYTLWAPPWEEDGEEWQAFLGAEDKILLFDSAAQLAQYIRNGAENDLSDHPEWEEITDLAVADLVPDDDYAFDLDGVYDLAARAPDRWSVTELADVLDMVGRIAECCDVDIVEPLTEIPEIGMLDLGADAFTGRSGDKAWDHVGMTIASDWETVCSRLGEYLDWRDDIELDEDLSKQQKLVDAAAKPINDPDALIAAEAQVSDDDAAALNPDDLEEPAEDSADSADEDSADEDSADEDSADEDSSDDDSADEATDPVPGAAVALTSSSPDSDPDAFAFWESAGILPVRVIVPEDRFGFPEGYTLRCYVDDAPIFMGGDQEVWLFRSPDTLLDVIEDPDRTPDTDSAEDTEHDLSKLATWDDIVSGVRDDDQPLAIADEDDVNLTEVDKMIRGEIDADAAAIARASDLLADIADYAELQAVTIALEGDGPLSALIAAARDGGEVDVPEGADSAPVVEAWDAALSEVASVLAWIE